MGSFFQIGRTVAWRCTRLHGVAWRCTNRRRIGRDLARWVRFAPARKVLHGVNWRQLASTCVNRAEAQDRNERNGTDRRDFPLRSLRSLRSSRRISYRARRSRPLSLPPRCALVVTNAQRAERACEFAEENRERKSAKRVFLPAGALRFRHAVPRAVEHANLLNRSAGGRRARIVSGCGRGTCRARWRRRRRRSRLRLRR